MDLKIFLGLGEMLKVWMCVRQIVIFIGAFSDLERKKKGLHLNLVRRKYPKLGPFLKERERKKFSSFNIINMSSQMRIVSVI